MTAEQRAELAELTAAGVRRSAAGPVAGAAGRACCSGCGRVRTGRLRPVRRRLPDGHWARAPGPWRSSAGWTRWPSSSPQSYPGARLDDIDLDALGEALGEQARVDVRELADLERELRDRASFERADDGSLRLSPKASAPARARSALRDVADRIAGRRGERETRRSGAAGEPTGSTRPWAFGDTQAWSVPRTLLNAQLRRAGGDPRVLDVTDVEVIETEQPDPGRGRAVRGHLVVDGAGRPVGADEAHRAGPAPADLHPVPRRRPGSSSRSAGRRRTSSWASWSGWRAPTCRARTCTMR